MTQICHIFHDSDFGQKYFPGAFFVLKCPEIDRFWGWERGVHMPRPFLKLEARKLEAKMIKMIENDESKINLQIKKATTIAMQLLWPIKL